jgi:Family of unknown function (DUF5670)
MYANVQNFICPTVIINIQETFRERSMFYTIAVVAAVLWMIGVAVSVTLGGFVHVLLAIAVIAVFLRVITRQEPA